METETPPLVSFLIAQIGIPWNFQKLSQQSFQGLSLEDLKTDGQRHQNASLVRDYPLKNGKVSWDYENPNLWKNTPNH